VICALPSYPGFQLDSLGFYLQRMGAQLREIGPRKTQDLLAGEESRGTTENISTFGVRFRLDSLRFYLSLK
jgi:hypothetical protein